MGVIFGQGPDIRRHPKTGFSRDFMLSRERGLTPKNGSGFANTIDHYLDLLDPRARKLKKKPKWLTVNSRLLRSGW